MVVARLGWILPGILAALLALPIPGAAAVKGTCSVCHTMHNSEQGSVVAFSRDSTGQPVLREQAFARLLKTDCLGCHTHTGAETIVDVADSQVPIVFNLTEPTYPPDGTNTSALAGGNFHWLIKGGDAYGHNVHGIAVDDLRFPPTLAPGGIVRIGECGSCHGTLATPDSGCTGCHVPQHHANGAGSVADQGQGWYRFLGSVMQRTGGAEPTAQGVVGIEAPDWEQNPQASLHNVYEGETGPYTGYLDSGSISQKCAGCHGRYHSESIADATWIRHPVDALIPNAAEFAAMTA